MHSYDYVYNVSDAEIEMEYTCLTACSQLSQRTCANHAIQQTGSLNTGYKMQLGIPYTVG